MARLFGNDEAKIRAGITDLQKAFQIDDKEPEKAPLIIDTIGLD